MTELRTVGCSAATTVCARVRLVRHPRRSAAWIFLGLCNAQHSPRDARQAPDVKAAAVLPIRYLVLIVNCTCPRSQLTRRVHERRSIILFSGPRMATKGHRNYHLATTGGRPRERRPNRRGSGEAAKQGGSRVVVGWSWGLRQAGTTGRYDRGAARGMGRQGTGSRAPTGLKPLTPG